MNHSARITLRDARADEAASLTRIAIAAKAGWGYRSDMLDLWIPQLTITAASIRNRFVTVAELNGIAVGFGGIDLEASIAEIDDLWVLPKYQNRRVGQSLFKHLCGVAQRHRVDRVLVVSDPNAAGFYERMGATQVGWHPSQPVGRMLPKFEIVLNST